MTTLSVVLSCVFCDPPTTNGINVGKSSEGLSTASDTVVKESEAISIDGFSAEQLNTLRQQAEKREFQAEVNRMMKLIINSLYKNKEIFLRELISNASDALDKVRLLSLTDKDALNATEELSIRIKVNKEARTMHIIDTGIGMSKEDMAVNLGTIAQSGTSDFLAKLASSQSSQDADLIGQFGVGFYSGFLVSKRIMVISKMNNHPQCIWESDSKSFKLIEDPRGDTLKRGTEIILFLNEEASDYLQQDTLTSVIKKYSQFINFPIYLWSSRVESVKVDSPEAADEKVSSEDAEASVEEEKKDKPKTVEKTIWDWVHVNKYKPIWKRNPSDITEDEYKDLYKDLSLDQDEPLAKVHFNAEGDVSFTALLYLPKRSPGDIFNVNYSYKNRIKLHVHRIFISDAAEELVPKFLGFVIGIVDSDDLPLNVSRETLQQNELVKVIRKKLTRKVIEMISKMSEEDFDKFWKEYSIHIKLGMIEDASNKSKLSKLLRYRTSKSNDTYTSLMDYKSRMKKDQDAIYYLTGASIKEVKSSPLVERLVKMDYEVIFMIDAIDEYVMQSLTEFEKLPLQNVAKEGVKLKTSDTLKETQQKDFEKLLTWLKEEALKDKIEKAELSERLSDSPCALVAGKYGWSGNMERIMRSQAHHKGDDLSSNYYSTMAKTFEINPRHPIIKKMNHRVKIDSSDKEARETAELLFYVATLRSGYTIHDSVDFAQKIELIMRKNLDVDELEEVEAEPEETEDENKAADEHKTDEDMEEKDVSRVSDEPAATDITHEPPSDDTNQSCSTCRRLLQHAEAASTTTTNPELDEDDTAMDPTEDDETDEADEDDGFHIIGETGDYIECRLLKRINKRNKFLTREIITGLMDFASATNRIPFRNNRKKRSLGEAKLKTVQAEDADEGTDALDDSNDEEDEAVDDVGEYSDYLFDSAGENENENELEEELDEQESEEIGEREDDDEFVNSEQAESVHFNSSSRHIDKESQRTDVGADAKQRNLSNLLETKELKEEGLRRLRKFMKWMKLREQRNRDPDKIEFEQRSQTLKWDADELEGESEDVDTDEDEEQNAYDWDQVNLEESDDADSDFTAEDIEDEEDEDADDLDQPVVEYSDKTGYEEVEDPEYAEWKRLQGVQGSPGARKLLAVKPPIPIASTKKMKTVTPPTVPQKKNVVKPTTISTTTSKPKAKTVKVTETKPMPVPTHKLSTKSKKVEVKRDDSDDLNFQAFQSVLKKPAPKPKPKVVRVVGTPNDHDCDGIPDDVDEDTDNDGLLDRTQDSDWDGELNHVDLDDDNDGIPDVDDEDANGDGIPDCRADTSDHQLVVRFKKKKRTVDSDFDGIPDDVDKDDDDDGIPDIMEDDDGDQIPDWFNISLQDIEAEDDLHQLTKRMAKYGWHDHDCDGIPDDLDPDDDNDGFFDNKQDSDRDGILNEWDDDDDNDGIPDSEDPDSNGDGIPDCIIKDTDGDGIPDHIDTDDDNDGIPDLQDPDHPTFNYFKDSDNDGIPDILDKDDDNDGIPDHNDQDADGDGTHDYFQDVDKDGVPDALDDDMDNDGIPDHLQDHDCDGIPDIIDPDDDNDGYFDNKQDSDNDGILNEWDDDDDNDGIPDKDDPDSNGDGILDCQPRDSDGDGIPDHLDDDDDNDGIPDIRDPDSISFLLYKHKRFLEAIPGIPDHLDPDANGDGIPDCRRDDDLHYKLVKSPSGLIKKVLRIRKPTQEEQHMTFMVNEAKRKLIKVRAMLNSPPPKKPLQTAHSIKSTTMKPEHNAAQANTKPIHPKILKVASPSGQNIKASKQPKIPDVKTQKTAVPPKPVVTKTVQHGNNPPRAARKLASYTPNTNKYSVEETVENKWNPDEEDEEEDDLVDLISKPEEEPRGGSFLFPGAMATDAQTIKKAALQKTKLEAQMKKPKPKKPTEVKKDEDGDGIPDYLEDEDGDGIPDYLDEDSSYRLGKLSEDLDGDGIPDHLEGDSDGDGILDYQEDSDGDGIPDYLEDFDGDGIPDYLDADSPLQFNPKKIKRIKRGMRLHRDLDNDNIPDLLEGDLDGDGVPDYLEDEDGDGIPDYLEDEDGDGIPDYLDEDSTYRRIKLYNDVDEDGIPDHLEGDSDGDGIPDYMEDSDGDGIPDYLEDSDGDGIPNYLDVDSELSLSSKKFKRGKKTKLLDFDLDHDGIPDFLEGDSDGNGVPDYLEDSDGDGVPDYLEDSDGDGIPDYQDEDATSKFSVKRIREIKARQKVGDLDGDGIPDHLQGDSDGDGIPDYQEDTDGDGIPDYLEDSDGDGIPDYLDEDAKTQFSPKVFKRLEELKKKEDEDGDGIPDYLEGDSDGDGTPDYLEDSDGDGIPDYLEDSDGDGIPDYLDEDSALQKSKSIFKIEDRNRNGIPDHLEHDSDYDGTPDYLEDTDKDGIPDYLEDSDEDGIPDYLDEDATTQFSPKKIRGRARGKKFADADHDGIPDHLEGDMDNNGILDYLEDADGDNIPDYLEDTDKDGIPDYLDEDATTKFAPKTLRKMRPQRHYADVDGDGIPDHLELDNDGDGIPDYLEDTDGDGIPDYLEDSDGDGIPDYIDEDAVSQFSQKNYRRLKITTQFEDNDGDGIPDHLQGDSDGDGVLDFLEDSDGDGTPDYLEDSDGDGVPDYLDEDADSQFSPKFFTDKNRDGIPDSLEGDSDGDGIPDYLEDTDGDGIPDYLEDSDGDGIPNYLDKDVVDVETEAVVEGFDSDTNKNGIPDYLEDWDADGIPNYLDDDDGDGIADFLDRKDNRLKVKKKKGKYRKPVVGDKNENGIPDYLEGDSDGDGVLDYKQDTDKDGIPDYLDEDDVNAKFRKAKPMSIPKTRQKFTKTPKSPLTVRGKIDTDGDGIPDDEEDADGDGIPDYLDNDADGDGKPDDQVKGILDKLEDENKNQIPDYLEMRDSDGDGIVDWLDTDDDNDNVPDYLDDDDDGDGILDIEEDENKNNIPDILELQMKGSVGKLVRLYTLEVTSFCEAAPRTSVSKA
ncbi:hypothetical protein EG68_03140 [Paragonimus skrjabini miyazakii]|uniref:Uncharacterized protein n=1 Tax=Paragonimus skrjabini miyazakii TaxID=59628 RepID=A0A8S9Z183_9TREM|nr:hypothetical protein EG68_03140 [Paragonimus skrjabini miyazakii]